MTTYEKWQIHLSCKAWNTHREPEIANYLIDQCFIILTIKQKILFYISHIFKIVFVSTKKKGILFNKKKL